MPRLCSLSLNITCKMEHHQRRRLLLAAAAIVLLSVQYAVLLVVLDDEVDEEEDGNLALGNESSMYTPNPAAFIHPRMLILGSVSRRDFDSKNHLRND